MKHLVFIVFALLLLIPTALGQENAEPIEPKDAALVNPEAHISWPPPVYVVRDNVDIRGTVSLATMRNFFIEFRPLMLGMMDDDEEDNPWLPGTLPRIEAVDDDILGSWNTVTLRDGLYELRLTINTGGNEPERYRVSPIRVENNPPAFMAEQQVVAVEEPGDAGRGTGRRTSARARTGAYGRPQGPASWPRSIPMCALAIRRSTPSSATCLMATRR